jgi:hypothetical protein
MSRERAKNKRSWKIGKEPMPLNRTQAALELLLVAHFGFTEKRKKETKCL